ncbi:MAG: hypothetical protein A2W80_05310 [Candidatus Riflebacteria bacterium GWC2_50_8]|nr:MAG: hypothetical protein A2W80_05310 [Candidatus Riflebacteria bacterium GWC2_50_8]
MKEKPRLFLDACVLVTAANSPTGGSARLLAVAAQRRVLLFATATILKEAQKNIVDLLGHALWQWFFKSLEPLPLHLVDCPSSKEQEAWQKVTHGKDTHVLAGAIKGSADILISLDRKHILNPEVQKNFTIPIMTPGEFLQKYKLISPGTE